MIYLNELDIKKIGIDWKELISIIEISVNCLSNGEYSQPIKPYLRYNDLKNRIIAMPAYIGGEFNRAGIKWIASFPDNIKSNIPRAHSVIILNDSENGKPVAIINTAIISIIRTASVSGLIIKYYSKLKDLKNINIGIVGFGPIGQYHLKMCNQLLESRISRIFLYDIKPIDKDNINFEDKDKITITDSWEKVYANSDIFITCTVAKTPYIDKKPKKGALILNVSLRDFKTDIYEHVKDSIIIDDWNEICRESTDIEIMHNKKGLEKEHTKSIIDVVCFNCMRNYSTDKSIMFNPMGMAVFDISVAAYYVDIAIKTGIDIELK